MNIKQKLHIKNCTSVWYNLSVSVNMDYYYENIFIIDYKNKLIDMRNVYMYTFLLNHQGSINDPDHSRMCIKISFRQEYGEARL